jgi:hypothetical protein
MKIKPWLKHLQHLVLWCFMSGVWIILKPSNVETFKHHVSIFDASPRWTSSAYHVSSHRKIGSKNKRFGCVDLLLARSWEPTCATDSATASEKQMCITRTFTGYSVIG